MHILHTQVLFQAFLFGKIVEISNVIVVGLFLNTVHYLPLNPLKSTLRF